ncbi:MAG TPA: helix-turn-helix domain-containing protein [Paracoccaceae bacterium]|nr:helix-turn-helix domain-containing protein [Paracoccaceae bacterium]
MIGDLLRDWRAARGYSQLELALEADISARHLSFVETGRARPSEAMVLRLARTLDVPLRERNAMLVAAGYAPRYRALPREAQAMAAIRRAMDLLLTSHAPFPAIALDAGFRVVEANAGFRALQAAFGLPEGPGAVLSDLVTAPGPLREAILNWADCARYTLGRLRTAVRLQGPGAPAAEALERAMAAPGVAEAVAGAGRDADLPILPVELRVGGTVTRWITTLTHFGGPLDIGVEELLIEQFHPADAETEAIFRDG